MQQRGSQIIATRTNNVCAVLSGRGSSFSNKGAETPVPKHRCRNTGAETPHTHTQNYLLVAMHMVYLVAMHMVYLVLLLVEIFRYADEQITL